MAFGGFAFVDDIFNLNEKNGIKLFRLIVKHKMKAHIFFLNGLRGDILSREYIDLMAESGTILLALALETASERLQKLIKKHIRIDKLHKNLTYICEEHPQIITSLFMMIGFPTESEEESRSTLDFAKSIKWLHFPELHIATAYPGTEMYNMVMNSGSSHKELFSNAKLALHDISTRSTFMPKDLLVRLRLEFLVDYWLNKERLRCVLPVQRSVMTDEEVIIMYNSFLKTKFTSCNKFLEHYKIPLIPSKDAKYVDENTINVSNVDVRLKDVFSGVKPNEKSFRILLIDVSHNFDGDGNNIFRSFMEVPLGLVCLGSYLLEKLGEEVEFKIIKPHIDYTNWDDLYKIVINFQPAVVGIRSLTYFHDFLCDTVKRIKKWRCAVPVIVGGPHSTEGILENTNVDIAVIGEGELTFYELIRAIIDNNGMIPSVDVLRNINGIAFRERIRIDRKAPLH